MSRRPVFIILGLGLCVLVASWMPISAQDVPNAFVTNTPVVRQAAFATNTPASAMSEPQPTLDFGPLVLATNTPQPAMMNPAPDASADRYALRRWDDAGLAREWIDLVQHLTAEDDARILGLQLFQKEIEQRFAGTPRNPALREQLLFAMLAAPPDTLDIRPVIRPYIEDILNTLQPDLGVPNELTIGDFKLSIVPANLDGRVGKGAAVYIRYLRDTNNSERDAALAVIDENGVYHVPQFQSPYPVVGMHILSSPAPTDWNGDGLDEMAVTVVKPGAVNGELYIYGWRGGGVVNLIEPGKRALYLGTPSLSQDRSGFALTEYREEIPAWQCFGERTVTWHWLNNFFRPQPADDFMPRDTLACRLAAAEPLFELPPDEAISTIDAALPSATPDDAYAAGRAAMTKVMLHLLNNETDVALGEIDQLSTGAQPGTWLGEQVAAFQSIINKPNLTPVQICATLEAASAYGACDVNAVLARLFSEFPLNREEEIDLQTARLGLEVADTATIKEVGKLDRQAIRFIQTGDQWWAFAPLGKDSYTAERIDTPIGREPISAVRPDFLAIPDTALEAMFVRSDPEEVLNILDNAARTNPGIPMGNAARFLQALSYDLVGSRARAQSGYYSLWSEASDSPWGQLAAAHLERR
ncbi:MAG: hypothetical protein R3E39_12755 [Anaerolineae bacterium]